MSRFLYVFTPAFASTRALILVTALGVAVAGCPSQPAVPEIDGGPDVPADDSGVLTDGGHEIPDAGPTLVMEKWGTKLAAPVLSLTRVNRTLWMAFANSQDIYTQVDRVRGGLGRLNLDTGEIRIFEEELPQMEFAPPDFFMEGPGPIPLTAVVEDEDRVLVAGLTGILVVKGDSVTHRYVETAQGQKMNPTALLVDRNAGRKRLWVSTIRGVVMLNADTFEAERWFTNAELGNTVPARMALDPSSGAVFVALHAADNSSKVVRILNGSIVSTFVPGEKGVTPGIVGDVVWSSQLSAAVIALATWEPTTGGVVSWDGTVVKTIATEGELSDDWGKEPRAFGASELAINNEDNLLIVGGRVRNGRWGGGLAWIDLRTPSKPLSLATLSWRTGELNGDHVVGLEYDPVTRRTYASVRFPCNESQMGNPGLQAISFDNKGSPRFERPILSGVRALAHIDGATYATLRDDKPGIACTNGVPMQSGYVRVLKNRSGEVVPLVPNEKDAEYFKANSLSPRALALHSSDHVALASHEDGLYAGKNGSAIFINQSEFGVSLDVQALAWTNGGRTLWYGGRANHDRNDPDFLADRGGRGAMRLDFAEDGSISGFKHYVRASEEEKDVVGLPTSEITAIVPAADGSVYMVCGTEKLNTDSDDHRPRETFMLQGKPRKGGVVQVAADGSFKVLAGGDVVPDGRAAALDATGALVVIDSERGGLRWNGTKFEPLNFSPALPPRSVANSLWYGTGGDFVAALDQGALVSVGGLSGFVGDVRFAWSATSPAPGHVTIGTDEGIVQVRRAETAVLVETAPGEGALPPFRARVQTGGPDPKTDGGEPPDAGPTPDAGVCIAQGSSCNGKPDGCCPGLVCASAGFVRTCEMP